MQNPFFQGAIAVLLQAFVFFESIAAWRGLRAGNIPEVGGVFGSRVDKNPYAMILVFLLFPVIISLFILYAFWGDVVYYSMASFGVVLSVVVALLVPTSWMTKIHTPQAWRSNHVLFVVYFKRGNYLTTLFMFLILLLLVMP